MALKKTFPFLKKFEPVDLIAIVLIIGCFTLKFLGADGTVSVTLALITGYYFGKQGRAPIDTYEQIAKAGDSDQKT